MINMLNLRLSCTNTTYHGHESRKLIMEVLEWSFAALGRLASKEFRCMDLLISVMMLRILRK